MALWCSFQVLESRDSFLQWGLWNLLVGIGKAEGFFVPVVGCPNNMQNSKPPIHMKCAYLGMLAVGSLPKESGKQVHFSKQEKYGKRVDLGAPG